MNFTPQSTKDGSFTFFSEEFDEAFHSIYGAKQEAEVKFVTPTELRKLAKTQTKIKILDICYGLGYNSAAAIAAIWLINPQCQIELVALEINSSVPQSAIANSLLDTWQTPIPNLLTELANQKRASRDNFHGELLLGDARQTIQKLVNQNWQADAIFLDPFSPPKCPQLWTIEFIALVASCLAPTGKLATYSCAAAVRTALTTAGLSYGSTPGMGRKAPGTLAAWDANFVAISEQEREHLNTRAAIPYRDHNLRATATEIKSLRIKEQAQSTLESTSKWKKRWQHKLADQKIDG